MAPPEIWKSWERHKSGYPVYHDFEKMDGWDWGFLVVVAVAILGNLAVIGWLLTEIAKGGR